MRRSVIPCVLTLLSAAPAVFGQCFESPSFQLTASNAQPGDQLGNALDASAEWIIASILDPGLDGGVYLYRRDNLFQEIRIDPPNPGNGDAFGYQVAIDGATALVSEPGYDTGRGRVHVYGYDGILWQPLQILEGVGAGEWFGRALALDETSGLLVVGTGVNAVDVYGLQAGTWSRLRRLNPLIQGDYGADVGVSGDQVAVAAPLESTGRGAVYLYQGSGTSWPQKQKLTAPGAQVGDQFGLSLGLDGAELAVGVPGRDGATNDEGAVLTWSFDGATWNPGQTLVSTAPQGLGLMGYRVDLCGDLLLAQDVKGPAPTGLPGTVMQFRRQGTLWVHQQDLYLDPAAAPFGRWLAAAPDDLVVLGAPLAEPGGVTDQGALYGFDLSGLSLEIAPATPSPGDKVAFSTCGGAPTRPVMLFVVGVGGAPLFVPLTKGSFDGLGAWTRTAIYGDPALAGLSLDLQSYGLDAAGRARASRIENLTLQ